MESKRVNLWRLCVLNMLCAHAMVEHAKGAELHLCPGWYPLICCSTRVTFGEFMSLDDHFGVFMSLVEHFGEFVSLVEHGWCSTIPPLSTCSMA